MVHFILIYPVHLKVIWAVHLKCCNQLKISINLKCMYKKSVLWRYNDSNFQIYGVWHKFINNLKVPKCHFEIKMTTICSRLHFPKISCIQSVNILTFYNRKWTFTTPQKTISTTSDMVFGAMLLFIYNLTRIFYEDYYLCVRIRAPSGKSKKSPLVTIAGLNWFPYFAHNSVAIWLSEGFTFIGK